MKRPKIKSHQFSFFCLLSFLLSELQGFQFPLLGFNSSIFSSSSSSSFNSKLQKDDSSFNFKLQHSIHIGTYLYPGLKFIRTFDDQDRKEIDLRSSSTNLRHHSLLSLNSMINPFDFYASTHQLKFKKGLIWSHNATWDQWNSVRHHQILIHQSQKRSKNATQTRLMMMKEGKDEDLKLDWKGLEIELPDVTDLNTLKALAKMTNNAYTIPNDERWTDPGKKWNLSDSFGWEEDGLRGHVFATPDNKSVVISIKGTSAGVLGNGGSTGANDKLNDNLLFSCCCARVSWSWSTVCDCYSGPYQCRQQCVERALLDKSVYFSAAVDLYNDVVTMYPHARIWLAGHSLGAALASLLGLTFGVPVVGFESPGDLLPARRLHLPLPPGASFGRGKEMSAVTHVFHTADPIAMGTCNGVISTCSVAGYAMESRCHVGQSIIYDTVGKLNWAVDIRTHSIKTVIESILIPDWDPTPPTCQPKSIFPLRWPWGKHGDESEPCDGDEKNPKSSVPEASVQECEEGDCFKWEFKDDWDVESSLDC
ncbi:lipase [Melampsora americana]|nr:lipase [Melampsora americana]